MSNQYKIQDPVQQYEKATPEFEQQQPSPGLETKMHPRPDDGAGTERAAGGSPDGRPSLRERIAESGGR